MTYYKQNGSDKPQSFITKGKQRLKQYLDTVYLNNGDEFEIELYNPTTNKFLAKIELNGVSIGSGIIIRPGERIFLERYIDEAKKFLFETYEVENNPENKSAIKFNGDVVVKFFKEKIINHTTLIPSNWTITSTGASNTAPTLIPSNWTITGASTTTSNWGISYTSNNVLLKSNSLETGRIEKGGHSNQNFTIDYSSFESMNVHGNWWKIRPMNEKSFTKEDLVVYCTECGAKRKKDTFKFCPHCGNKF
jgi:hypothetical protein